MSRLFFHRARNLTLMVLTLACPALMATEPPPEQTTGEWWYQVTVGGENAGWMRLAVTEDGGGVSTSIEQKMSFRRGQVELSVELASRFVETPEGEPISAWTRQDLGGQGRETFYEFTPEAILVRSAADGAVERRERRPATPWLTPVQTQRRLLEALAAGEEAFSFHTLDPTLGVEPIEVDWRRQRTGVEISAASRSWLTSEWRQHQSWAPQLATLVYLDEAGQLIRSETELFGMEVVQTLAEGDLSTQRSSAPEVLVSTFVKPDRPLRRARELRRAVYELSAEHELPPLPRTSVQAVHQEGTRARVEVDLDRPPAAAESGFDPESLLAATPFYDHDAPAVQEMLQNFELAPASSETDRALALRQLVAESLSDKNLDSIFDTASEVAVSRAGDCTEHSVLLTALLRGAGLPARSVMGLVYADAFVGAEQIFVYHMWSQAWIDGRWIDLDATLESARFDAAHIALQIVSLEDRQAMMRELAAMAPLMGELEIRVLETDLR